MSHFYGTLDGMARTTATRRGNKNSGITTYAAGWSGAIRVTVWHDDDTGKDKFCVDLVPWQSSGGYSKELANGELTAPPSRN